ncbi:SRPBCC family protein [Sphingomonas sp. LB-2]|uniref:SRPBCC family protein n=1 Tax=Sphingomonas caeni TaxID=2984949 RepID=UPI002232AE4C|nr:SRPBCC family protein [Sphingomonas caeni]MCW3846845.1 SRPBCC family protein [Sphingomonas caeni]
MTDTQRIQPAPIRKTMRVKASRERAFEVFVSRMGSWWYKDHSILRMREQIPQADVVVEPREGGRWYERGEDGSEYDWGRVLAWDPPGRLALAWQLTGDWEYDPDFETTVEVSFTEDGEYTEVVFEHRDLERYGEAISQLAGMDAGWGAILAGYEKALAG